MNIKNNRKIIVAIAIVVLCVVFPISILSSLWEEAVPAFQKVSAVEVAEKVRKAEKQGGTLELNNAEVNSIVNLYFDRKLKSMPMVKGLNVALGDDTVELFVEGLLIERIKFLIYVQGELSIEDGNIIFTPVAFKVGRFPLPKIIAMNNIKDLAYQGIEVRADSIEFKKALFPVEITDISLAADKITLEIKKHAVNVPEKVKGADSVPEQKPGQNKIESSGENAQQQNSQPPVPDQTKIALLQQVNSQLAVVHSKVKTAKEKEIIATMMGTVGNLINDLSSPYKGQAQYVLSEYSKLTTQEKKDLKQVMLTNMDIQTAVEVKNLFGL